MPAPSRVGPPGLLQAFSRILPYRLEHPVPRSALWRLLEHDQRLVHEPAQRLQDPLRPRRSRRSPSLIRADGFRCLDCPAASKGGEPLVSPLQWRMRGMRLMPSMNAMPKIGADWPWVSAWIVVG
jgi:hypothetical protein